MSRVRTWQATVWQNGGARLLARVEGDDDNDIRPVVQADISAITYTVYQVGSTAAVASGSLVVATVIHDTLQTGDVWTVDSTGFNFDATVSGSTFFPQATVYLVVIKFTLASGTSPLFLEYELTAKRT